jgi:hypothetical protein
MPQPNSVRVARFSNHVGEGFISDDVARILEQLCSPESEVWEAPFERWLRMADDLLRDWPATKSRPQGRKI